MPRTEPVHQVGASSGRRGRMAVARCVATGMGATTLACRDISGGRARGSKVEALVAGTDEPGGLRRRGFGRYRGERPMDVAPVSEHRDLLAWFGCTGLGAAGGGFEPHWAFGAPMAPKRWIRAAQHLNCAVANPLGRRCFGPVAESGNAAVPRFDHRLAGEGQAAGGPAAGAAGPSHGVLPP